MINQGCGALASFQNSSTKLPYLPFDATAVEDSAFVIAMPKAWDEALGISYQVYWTHPATTTNFGTVWDMYAKEYSNDDNIDGASYTGIGTVTDTGGTTHDLYISPESASSAFAAAAEGDLVHFIIRRTADSGSDTLAVDAWLIGVKVFYTTNAVSEA
jgi:hypothetical protein